VTEKGKGVIERIDVFRDEALIRDEEHLLFRAKAGEIQKTKGTTVTNEKQKNNADRNTGRSPGNNQARRESETPDDETQP
jgi:hypothetical protein